MPTFGPGSVTYVCLALAPKRVVIRNRFTKQSMAHAKFYTYHFSTFNYRYDNIQLFTNHSNRVVLCASTQQMAVYANRFVYKNTRRRKRSGRDVAHKQKEEGNSFTDDNLWSRLPCEFSKEA